MQQLKDLKNPFFGAAKLAASDLAVPNQTVRNCSVSSARLAAHSPDLTTTSISPQNIQFDRKASSRSLLGNKFEQTKVQANFYGSEQNGVPDDKMSSKSFVERSKLQPPFLFSSAPQYVRINPPKKRAS